MCIHTIECRLLTTKYILATNATDLISMTSQPFLSFATVSKNVQKIKHKSARILNRFMVLINELCDLLCADVIHC
jgi:hypothetical protein